MFIDDTDYFFGAVFAAESKRLKREIDKVNEVVKNAGIEPQ